MFLVAVPPAHFSFRILSREDIDAGMGQFFSRKTAPFMPLTSGNTRSLKCTKVNNEDSQQANAAILRDLKCTKVNNERFST